MNVNYEEVHTMVGKKVVAVEPALNQFIIHFNDGTSFDIQTDDEPMHWKVVDGEETPCETRFDIAKKVIDSWPDWKKEIYHKLLRLST